MRATAHMPCWKAIPSGGGGKGRLQLWLRWRSWRQWRWCRWWWGRPGRYGRGVCSQIGGRDAECRVTRQCGGQCREGSDSTCKNQETVQVEQITLAEQKIRQTRNIHPVELPGYKHRRIRDEKAKYSILWFSESPLGSAAHWGTSIPSYSIYITLRQVHYISLRNTMGQYRALLQFNFLFIFYSLEQIFKKLYLRHEGTKKYETFSAPWFRPFCGINLNPICTYMWPLLQHCSTVKMHLPSVQKNLRKYTRLIQWASDQLPATWRS